MKKTVQTFGSLAATLFAFAGMNAQKTDSIKTHQIDETIIIGTRNKNRILTDVPAPIDVLNVSEIIATAPQTSVNQILNYVAPSFTSNPTSSADGTDHIDPAQLRGLGTDQTLVLLNGKRRHTTALVNINGSPGRGSVGTDLNAIPSFAIQNIEVLRDGSAAQYGSDAIAGIINVNLKKEKGFSGALQYGGNLSSASHNFGGGMDGQLYQLDMNYGAALGKKGGFINITASVENRGATSRAGVRNNAIFNGYNAVDRVAGANGVELANLYGNINSTPNQSQILSYIKQFAPQVGYFTTAQLSAITNANTLSAMQTALNFDTTNNELRARGLQRKDFDMRLGQSKFTSGQLYYNAKYPLSENTSLYSFGGLSYRRGGSYAFYRLPNGSGTTDALGLNGFLPEIASDIYDFSTALGITSKVAGFDVDVSSTLGTNIFNYTIENTENATMGYNSPNTFRAGGLAFLQDTNNLDFTRNFNFLQGLNVAFGGEYRYENFKITQGDPDSWASYDINGNLASQSTPASQYVTDFFGNKRGGGSQGFSGFQPQDAINKSRRSAAAYIDLELNPTKNWMVDAAARYENYSDFGNTINYKLATLVKITPDINWRASGQTGFRAPSLQQKYFSSTTTQFLTDSDSASPTYGQLVPKQVTFFTNESLAANLVGIPKLKPEKSKSVSTGITFKIPRMHLSVAVDAFFTRIDDRVILTGAYARPTDAMITAAADPNVKNALLSLQQAFDAKGAERASFFSNGINTETKGLDVVVTHTVNFGQGIRIKSDLAGSYNYTQRVGTLSLPQTLLNSGANAAAYAFTYFPESSKIYLESAIPHFKASLGNTFTYGKFEILLRNSYFGKVTDPGATDVNLDGYSSVYEHPVYSGKLITDLAFSYQFSRMIRLTVGANNICDVYPDTNPTTVPAFVNTTPGLSSAPSTDLSNANQYVYSRGVSQFGLGGRYVFARINFKF